MTESDRHSLQIACDQLISSQKTLLLATRSSTGNADISYAPYLREGQVFYIFVSELAKHTQNLLTYPKASIMFIEPETDAANLFARKRLTLECLAAEISRADPAYSSIMDAMTEKFGTTMALLRSLPDFHLLTITPLQGQFVAGFGKAISVNADGLLQ